MTNMISKPKAPPGFPASERTDRNEVTDVLELVLGREKDLLAWLSPLVRRQSVTLDLGRVRRIDAAGVSALVSLYSSAKKAGHHFKVANPSPHVAEILRLVGLEGILLFHRAAWKTNASSRLEQSAA